MGNRVSYTFIASDRFSAAARRIRMQTERMRKGFRGLKVDVAAASASMTRLGQKMKSTSVVAGAAAVGTLKAFGDLEKGVANVITLLDDEVATEKYSGRLKILAEDAVRAGFSIQDSTKGLFDTVSALGAGEKAFRAFEISQKLAKGGVTDLSIAVDGITSVVKAYGDDVTDADEVANAFFTAQKKGKTTVGSLASNIGKVAPIAKNMGVSFQELLAVMSQLTLGGLSTEEASTALRGVLNSLQKPSIGAAKTLKKLGVPMRVTGVRAAGLTETLKLLTEATEKDADALALAIPNVRALTGAASLGAKELANVDEIMRRIGVDFKEGTGLNQAATLQMSTFNDEMARTWGSIKILGAHIGASLVPVVKAIGWFVRKLTAGFDLLPRFIKPVVGFLLGIFAIAAPVLAFFGKFSVVMVAIGKGIAAVAAAVGAVVAGAGIALVAIIAAVVAGLALVIWKWEYISGKIIEFKDKLKGFFGGDVGNVDVVGSADVSQTAKSEHVLTVKAPKGTVESIKTKTSGLVSGLSQGVNMQEAM
jgi:TP901 family phage tail tape measure protein